jgi:folate-binding Fe-S cluster repair protein YgfZ
MQSDTNDLNKDLRKLKVGSQAQLSQDDEKAAILFNYPKENESDKVSNPSMPESTQEYYHVVLKGTHMQQVHMPTPNMQIDGPSCNSSMYAKANHSKFEAIGENT